MPVNVNQYREEIGVFNNRDFIATKKSFYFTESKSVREMSLTFLVINMVVLSIFFLLPHAYKFLSPKT